MSVAMFANALRTQSRLRVLTATHALAALPATRSISSLVAFRTAVLKNVSLSASRSFTTSQVARNEDASRAAPTDTPCDTISSENNESEEVTSRAAPSDTIVAANNESASSELPSNTIFVGNISWNATEEDISLVFAKFGEIKNIKLHMHFDGHHRGSANIDFASKDGLAATMASVAQKPLSIAGREMRVESSPSKRPRPIFDPNSKLYYLGCSDESEIKTIFQKFSDSITEIFPLKDPQTGGNSRAGLIQFKSIAIATEALNSLNGIQTSDGKQLVLAYSRPLRANRKSSSRRRNAAIKNMAISNSR